MKKVVLAAALALSFACWGLIAQDKKGYDPDSFALESGRGQLSKEYFGVRLDDVRLIEAGVIRSLLIITTVHTLNLCLILLTPSNGVVLAIQRVFWDFPSAFVKTLLSVL